MPRKTLLIALPLAAGVLGTTVADAAAPRAFPISVRASTSPKKDSSRPYTFTTKGVVNIPDASKFSKVCPPGSTDLNYCISPTKAQICKGAVVAITFKKGDVTVSNRRAFLDSTCHYRSKVSFSIKSPLRRGKLVVANRFQGNTYLLPRNAPRYTVTTR